MFKNLKRNSGPIRSRIFFPNDWRKSIMNHHKRWSLLPGCPWRCFTKKCDIPGGDWHAGKEINPKMSLDITGLIWTRILYVFFPTLTCERSFLLKKPGFSLSVVCSCVTVAIIHTKISKYWVKSQVLNMPITEIWWKYFIQGLLNGKQTYRTCKSPRNDFLEKSCSNRPTFYFFRFHLCFPGCSIHVI